jgi:hypothetical protein
MRAQGPDDDPLGHLVDDELSAAFEAAAAEFRTAHSRAVLEVLERVRRRGTPLRAVSRYSSEAVRLQFADGSAVLVHSRTRGQLATVGLAVARQRPVVVSDVQDDGTTVLAVLRWDAHHVDIEVLGRDQAE